MHDNHRFRRFDPNTGQDSFDTFKDLEIGVLHLRMDYSRRHDIAGFEVQRLDTTIQAG